MPLEALRLKVAGLQTAVGAAGTEKSTRVAQSLPFPASPESTAWK